MEARANAARAIGILRGREAIPDLAEALRSKDSQVIYESLIAFQKIRDPSAGPYVAFLLRDLDEKVQIAAIETTGLLTNRGAINDLRDILDRSKKMGVKRAALTALAQMPDPQLHGIYIARMGDKDEGMRVGAAEGLARLKNPDDRPKVESAFSSEKKTGPPPFPCVRPGQPGQTRHGGVRPAALFSGQSEFGGVPCRVARVFDRDRKGSRLPQGPLPCPHRIHRNQGRENRSGSSFIRKRRSGFHRAAGGTVARLHPRGLRRSHSRPKKPARTLVILVPSSLVSRPVPTRNEKRPARLCGKMKLMTKSFQLCLAIAMAGFGQTPPAPKPAEAVPPVSLNDFSSSLENLVNRVRPSVVQIYSTGYATSEESDSTTASLLSKQHSTGSGIILTEDGYIVTNAHVVKGARRIQVRLPSRSEASGRNVTMQPEGKLIEAKLVGLDRDIDVAVVKIEKTGLPFLAFGDSNRILQGELVMAFGSPLGLESSVSMGVVSSVARALHPDDMMVYIQTDAPINPGNSGGPLVDAQGRVIGINTFILTQSGGSEGLGFAIPSSIVKSVYGADS